MNTHRILFLISIYSASVGSVSAVECDMRHRNTHGDANRTKIYSSVTGVKAIYYHADMDVNTDGSARSYHPDDPRGQTKALNNMGNAITRIYSAAGRNITCSPRSGDCYNRFITTFEQARDAQYDPVKHPRITTDGIIPWEIDASLGRSVPCTITQGAFKGYFVSQTSVAVDPTKSTCDQARYLDSLVFNAVVLPGNISWKAQGVETDDGDLVVVRDRATGRIAYAINGDRGPAKSIGEGTIALTAILKGQKLRGDETYREIRSLKVADVDYLTFPADDIRRKVGAGHAFTQQDIERFGKQIFESWGGEPRLKACAEMH